MPEYLTEVGVAGILIMLVLKMVFEFVNRQGRKKCSPHGWATPADVHQRCDRLESKLDRIATATEKTVLMIEMLQKQLFAAASGE